MAASTRRSDVCKDTDRDTTIVHHMGTVAEDNGPKQIICD